MMQYLAIGEHANQLKGTISKYDYKGVLINEEVNITSFNFLNQKSVWNMFTLGFKSDLDNLTLSDYYFYYYEGDASSHNNFTFKSWDDYETFFYDWKTKMLFKNKAHKTIQ